VIEHVKFSPPLTELEAEFYREAKRVVEWLDRLAAAADERAKDRTFPSLADANAWDAKNYRASAKGLRAAIAKADAR
jgi:hypothetical protein